MKKTMLLSFTFLCAILVASSKLASSSVANVKILQTEGSVHYSDIPPLISGWGGCRIQEACKYSGVWTSYRNTPPSGVFSGEVASDLEMTVKYLQSKGYNSIRVIFDGPLSWSESTSGPDWQWNETCFARSLEICKHYGIWIVVDYHGDGCDAYQHTDQWVSFWQNIIQKYGSQYDKIVWEPSNEPLPWYKDNTHELTGQTAVNLIGQLYQRWIDMCRNASDNHWIVVSCVCWWNSLPEEDWWPNVTDPMSRVFLGRHHYFFYQYNTGNWTVAAAQAQADHDFQIDQKALTKYGKPFLSTEFGADFGSQTPPDVVYVNGTAKYSPTSVAFVQKLAQNYKMANRSYHLWMCGDWGPPGLYGDMNIWGSFVN